MWILYSLLYVDVAVTEWRYQNTKTDTETFFPIPNFPKPKPRLFSKTKFFRNRDFFQKPNFLKPKPRLFPRPNFSETKTETFFPRPNFPKPKLKPSKNWQKFQNREVSKPKCQSLAIRLWYDIMWYGYEPMKKLHFIIPSHNWI